VRGAFALEAHEAAVLRGRAVLLLDDVATTGSTLLEAHAALAMAEPAWILALAAAHGGRGGGPQFGPDA
jgi:predicted amidophosphoribosyltransferase